MAGAPSLIDSVHRLLERTYRMRSGIERIARFLIGDAGYRRLYDELRPSDEVASAGGSGARTLVRETDEGVRACIYYPDDLIRGLEASPPQHGLSNDNIDGFATLVEELDHLLCVAERARLGRPVTLFELELHANVSKYLVLARFLVRPGAPLEESRRLWLRHHLFEKLRFSDEDPHVRRRYGEAARWAVKFIDALPGMPVRGRLDTLRCFHAAPSAEKIGLIENAAA